MAPALYEGLSSFLAKTGDNLSDLATYSALYMGLISVAGFTGFKPRTTNASGLEQYYNGVFASMFMHSAVVLIAVIYRLAATGHVRDSDKLVFLWRARYVPLMTMVAFTAGTVSAINGLMSAVADTVATGQNCFPDDPTMEYALWWNQWTGFNKPRVGQGVVYDEGEEISNPWMEKAKELELEWTGPKYYYGFWYDYDGDVAKYHEFMMVGLLVLALKINVARVLSSVLIHSFIPF